GDETSPPGDESSDYEFEAEEANDELEVEEDGESSTTRDPQFVGGLAPWAFRRDLEALQFMANMNNEAGGSGGVGGSGRACGSGVTGGNTGGGGNAGRTGVRGAGPT
nr:hypothetical protein [Tanacetum cinerariifolium]